MSTPAERALDVIQGDLELTAKPFAAAAARIGCSEAELLGTLQEAFSAGRIRELAAILDPKKIGYRSTLVAAHVPPGRFDEAVRRISRHSGVSHNYERSHPYNVWFTIAVAESGSLEETVRELLEPVGVSDYLLLRSVKTFKLRVKLAVAGAPKPEDGAGGQRRVDGPGADESVAVTLSDTDRRLLARLEEPLPLTSRPWASVGEDLGMDEVEVMRSVDRLKRAGVIRRVSGVLRHRKLGFTANGMACFAVDTAHIDEAGEMAASFPAVSHCYHREAARRWGYPLFAMIHARSEEECLGIAGGMAKAMGCADYQVLFSTRELKKERVKYFSGAMIGEQV